MLITEQMYTLSNLTLQYLHTLPNGTEITTEETMRQACATQDVPVYADWDLYKWHELHYLVLQRAPRQGLMLDDSKYAEQEVGLPHHIPYVVKYKKPSP
ncbi:MAG: hypothetical protein IJB36_06505 [Clostridia bacterium]|nr:hypothetical protein [Clostridia bacterium]